jgi:hypothetical protein
MTKTERATKMKALTDMIHSAYDHAGDIRDYTDKADEKEVFNKIRGALYDLRQSAFQLWTQWDNQK